MSEPAELNNPPKDTTKLVAPQPKKKIKLMILRDVADPASDVKNPTIWPAGKVVDVSREHAKDLLSRKYLGIYPFSGQRESVEKTRPIRVAERYVEPAPKELDDLEQE